MKFLLALFVLFASDVCLSQERLALVCNVMVDPVPQLNPTAKFRVDQFLFEDPEKAEAAVFWHPWGGVRVNMLAVPLQKTRIVTHRSDPFPGAHTIVVIPEGTATQFKIKLFQTASSGVGYSFIDVKYGTMDTTGEVRVWEDFMLKDPSNNNQPAGACKYNKLF